MADYEMDETEDKEERNPLERLRDTFHEEVDDLAKLELDVEEFAERKAGLLRQYLKEDVHGVQEYWRDLWAEVDNLEEFLGYWLLQAANPTPLDWAKLDQYISRGDSRLMAGETARDMELACVDCGTVRVVEGEETLKPCNRCGCQLFDVRRRFGDDAG